MIGVLNGLCKVACIVEALNLFDRLQVDGVRSMLLQITLLSIGTIKKTWWMMLVYFFMEV